MLLYFIRHGDPVYSPDSLTPLGHEQAKALERRGHEVVVISSVGVTPMMKRLRPGQAEVAARTPKEDVIDGVKVYYPRYLTLGNAGEKLEK